MADGGAEAARSGKVWTGLAILLVALLIRGVYLYESSDNPTFLAPIVDAKRHHFEARDLAEPRAARRSLTRRSCITAD